MNPELFKEVQLAIRVGDKTGARSMLKKAILASPNDAQAWLLMAQVVDKREQVIDCLQRVMSLDPGNQHAGRALAALAPAPKLYSTGTRDQAVHPVTPMTRIKQMGMEFEDKDERYQLRMPVNWPLIIGAVIVLCVIIISLVGPKIAPSDPLEENVILKFGDVWDTPPIPPFQHKEYPLGTDQFGRDMLSRILWAVQPTISMVTIVAITRLSLGTIMGMCSGWLRSPMDKWLDGLITAALAVPVFMVSLGVIAMLGAEMGILAFIIGFSINGWGEVARIVREQTLAVKKQLYIEAAQAIGASSFQVLMGHVLRQIMPMAWMLLAFEISNTLMITAGLGFLGYYIGGDVWIEVGDFVSRRVSGMPELGQMLATSWAFLTKPWPMVITGTIVFVTVLGFNLLGEGLRNILDPEKVKAKKPFSMVRRRFSWWVEEQITRPVNLWARENALATSIIGSLMLLLLGSLIFWRIQDNSKTGDLSNSLIVPGKHIWVSERGDPYGTYWRKLIGPIQPRIQWQFQIMGSLAGGPAIAANGVIYVGVTDGRLLALNPDGSIFWEITLPEIPTGPPTLNADGVVYIGGQNGGLMAIKPHGELLWHFQPDEFGTPIHGPMVGLNGNIFYLLDDPRADHLVSLNPEGGLRWLIPTGTKSADTGPRLSPKGDMVYIKNVIVDADDGSLIEVETPADQDPVLANRAQYLVGADGENYLHVGHTIIHWMFDDSDFEVIESAEWSYHSAGFNQFSSFPVDAGVTLDKTVWLFYSRRYGGTQMVWVDVSGKMLGISYTNLRSLSKAVAVDQDNTAFICGVEENPDESVHPITKCLAYDQGTEEPKWELILNDQEGNNIIGGALATGRIYIVTEGGYFYAIGQDISVVE